MRDTQDTFYITEKMLLRTQTSPVQIRVMEQQKPPIRIIAPGRVYRSDAVDATHSPLFHQIEGLVVDEDITMGDLKGTLEAFAKRLYGDDTRIRLRPHHFPFTEPSCEIDVSVSAAAARAARCARVRAGSKSSAAAWCTQRCCKTAASTRSSMSAALAAFGVGLERLVMFRFNIDDMRLLYENDMRFLSQF